MAIVLTIEGNIGAGKSTLLNKCKEHLGLDNVVYLQEPVHEWEKFQDHDGKNMLELFYEDVPQYSFPFQIMALITRAERLRDAIRDHPNSVILCERSMFTDREVFARMLYDDGHLEHLRYSVYLKCFELYTRELKMDGMLYLKTKPATCCERIAVRGRKGESIPMAYLEQCHDAHEAWVARAEKPVGVLNGEADSSTLVDDARAFIRGIIS
jgi:deoxyadenosine/deoxycytidine kinase